MRITDITIATEPCLAHVTLYTDVPTPFSSQHAGRCLFLQFDAPPSTVEQYCRDNFPEAEIRIIDASVPW